MSHVFLVLAYVALILAVVAQDWLDAPLQSGTISDGLPMSSPYHWWLDATFVVLAVALCGAHPGGLFAWAAAFGLLLAMASATFSRYFGPNHAKVHDGATALIFASALGMAIRVDHGWLWCVSALAFGAPALAYLTSRRVDITEKVAVLCLAIWTACWALAL